MLAKSSTANTLLVLFFKLRCPINLKAFLQLFILFHLASNVHAKTCPAIDLRNKNLTQQQTQIYSDNKELKDSRMCAAHTFANLVSQRVGFSVSAIDIAFQEAQTWDNPLSTPKNKLFTNENEWGGHIYDHFKVMKKIGFCREDSLRKYLNSLNNNYTDWYNALGRRSDQIGYEKLVEEINEICGKRIHLDSKIEYIESSWQSTGTMQTPSPMEFVAEVDRLLNSKRFVALSYYGHYATVVGRTKECEYLIQDSVPASYRKLYNWKNLYSRTIGEHIQIWSVNALAKALDGTKDFNNIHSIGYLK